jgi:hypothetical protein
MAVTFGTPVVQVLNANAKTMTFAMSGVTSGQPIVIVWSPFQYNASSEVTYSDTFSTPYTYTQIDNSLTTAGSGIVTAILTGGSGTSGTITIVTTYSNDEDGGVAIPCIGASTASGLSAVDVHGIAANAASLTPASVSLTPGASGEGAVYGCMQAAYATPAITGSPGSPWVNTACNYTSYNFLGVATYASPASGSALATSWTLNSSKATNVAGVIVKAAGAAVATDGFFF